MASLRLRAALQGNLANKMVAEAASIDRGILKSVRSATDDIKLAFRRVIKSSIGKGRGLGRSNARPSRLAKTVRGLVFREDNAAIVFSKFGRGKPGSPGFVDFFEPFVFGARIRARKAERLFIALAPRVRKTLPSARRALTQEKGVRVIPLSGGRAIIVKETRTRTQPLALLLREVRIRRRLDFAPVYRQAERILPEKLAENLADDA